MKTLVSMMILILCGQVALAQKGLPDDVRRALPAGGTPTTNSRPAVTQAAKPAPAPASDESLDQQWDDALVRYQNIAAQANNGHWEAEVLERLDRLAAAMKAQQAQLRQAAKGATGPQAPAAAMPPAPSRRHRSTLPRRRRPRHPRRPQRLPHRPSRQSPCLVRPGRRAFRPRSPTTRRPAPGSR